MTLNAHKFNSVTDFVPFVFKSMLLSIQKCFLACNDSIRMINLVCMILAINIMNTYCGFLLSSSVIGAGIEAIHSAANILVRLVETGPPREGPRIRAPQGFRMIGSIAWSGYRPEAQSLPLSGPPPLQGHPTLVTRALSLAGVGRTDVCPTVITRPRP